MSRVTFAPALPVIHSTALGQSPTDSALWEYARTNGYVIVTKDADFSELSLLRGFPRR